MTRSLTILFSGMIAADPWQGGATWAVLQYLLGLRRLGHDVYFIEPIKAANVLDGDLPSESSRTYFSEVTAAFELQDRAALLLEGTRTTIGLPYARLAEIACRADILINVSGMLTDEALFSPVPVRIYLDLDPTFVQLWNVQGIDMHYDGHTHFVTVGQAIGKAGCDVPTCGREWITTFQPVVLDQWPQVEPEDPGAGRALTTVGNWRGYGSIEYGGRHYGQKAHSLRQFIDLPRRTRQPLDLALAIHPGEAKDLEALKLNGWGLIDPAEVASTPRKYRQFIQRSRGEFGVAKSGYVTAKCGWFSDRSACYLASGRPVIAQQTGFSRFLPTGNGLWAFETSDDALNAIEELNGNYVHHCRAARALAEEHFDSAKVLTRLLALTRMAA